MHSRRPALPTPSLSVRSARRPSPGVVPSADGGER
ncbi:hypothetical protein HNR70_001067 [Brachybacterium aquaticum]|uniref:Uncharacterized protein n=1 Tax=Brachybacterium aquaticum TaxID=1432564 RepID=A0A841ADM3_9MICO|nr:hypothetical protein [Brachybacterium aquaticum]